MAWSKSEGAKNLMNDMAAGFAMLASSAAAAWPAIKSIMKGTANLAFVFGQVASAMSAYNAQMKAMTGADTGALHAMLYVFKAIAIAIGVLVAAAAVAAFVVIAPFVAIYDAAMIAWQGIKAGWDALVGPMVALGSIISSAFSAAWNAIKEFAAGFMGLGGDMMAGLVEGIKAAAGAVVKAITGVVGAGIDAAKGALGMNSPSKVFAHMGAMSALGYEEGFTDVGANIPAMSASAVAPSFGGGGANVTQNNSNTFNVTEAQSAEDTARMVKRMQLMEMASAFEQMAVEIGG
jgi:hypothetical protein